MPFIVIEGTDGSGKTSVAKILQQKLNATLIKTSMTPYLPDLRQYVDAHPENVMARFTYFLSLNKYTADTRMGPKNAINIFDRYVFSTFAAHVALDEIYNKGKDVAEITQIYNQERKLLPAPDAIIFLYADSKVREERLNLRKNQLDHLDTNKKSTDRKQELFKAIASELLAEKVVTVVEIDTTKLSLEQIVDKILGSAKLRKLLAL